MRVEEGIEIARPRDEVWRFVSEPANDPRWCSKVQSVEQVGDGRWRVLHKPVPLKGAQELMLDHIETEAPARLRMREEDEAAVFDVTYRLDDLGGMTRVTQTSEFEWKTLPRILHGTFRRGVERDVRRQLHALKAVLETADASAAT